MTLKKTLFLAAGIVGAGLAVRAAVPRRPERPASSGEPDPPVAPAPPARTDSPWGAVKAGVETAAPFVAPGTLVVSLVVYIGWVRTHDLYLTLGVDADDLGLSTSDYVLRSPDALWQTIALLALISLLALAGHSILLRLFAGASSEEAGKRRKRVTIRVVAALALLLTVTGPVVLASPRWQDSRMRPLGPLALAFGLGLFAYSLLSGLSFRRRRRKRRVEIPARWSRMISWILLVLAALCLFWSAALYAQELGAGAAQTLVDQRFARKPDVIVYSTSRINVDAHDVTEDDLGPAYAPYRYRYSGFKLLVHANKRLLLIPFDWSTSNAFAIVLPEDGTRLVFAPYLSTS